MIKKKYCVYGIFLVLMIFFFTFLRNSFETDNDKKNISIIENPGVIVTNDSTAENNDTVKIQKNKIHVDFKKKSNLIVKSYNNCLILETDPIVIFSPIEGKIQYFVKLGDLINQGDIVAEITKIVSKETIKTAGPTDLEILEAELESKKNDIRIAYMDIENISNEMEELNNTLMAAKSAYSTALIDFENNEISKEQMDQAKDDFERSKIHVADLEKMLDGKYTAINLYEDRITELETTISASESSKKRPLKIISDFTGRVEDLFFNDNQKVQQYSPFLTIMASNVAFVECPDKLAFSLDGNKALLTVDTEKFQAEGTLKFVRYQKEKGRKTTVVMIVFKPEINIQQNFIGKKAALTCHLN